MAGSKNGRENSTNSHSSNNNNNNNNNNIRNSKFHVNTTNSNSINRTSSEHGRRIFSVDDDPEEVKHDLRYLEGLHDGFNYANLKGKHSFGGLQPVKSAPIINKNSPIVMNNNNNNNSNNNNTDMASSPDLYYSTTTTPILNNHNSTSVNSNNNIYLSQGNNNNNNNNSITPRPKPKSHRSISKIASLTTPECGLGFDFKNNNSNNNNNNNNNNGQARNSTVSRYNLDNDTNDFYDSSNRNQSNIVIHDSSNNNVMLEEIPCNNDDPNIDNIPGIENNNDYDNDDDNADYFDRVSTASSVETFTLKERQDAINKTHPFGIRIWKPALYKKQRSVQRAADEDIHETRFKKISWSVHLTNLIWTLTWGVFLFLIFIAAGTIVAVLGLFTKSSRDYSMVLFKLARYLLWPFGKVVYLSQDEHYLQEDKDEGISAAQFYKWVTSYSNRLFFHQSQSLSPALNNADRLQYPSYGSIQDIMAAERDSRNGTSNNRTNHGQMNTLGSNQRGSSSEAPSITNLPNNNNAYFHENDNNISSQQRRYFGRGKWTIGRIYFYLIFHLILEPIVMVLSLLTWLCVFTIPISNTLWNLLYHCRKHPLALGYKNIKNSTNLDDNPLINSDETKNILLCTFRCAGWHYYKFTVDGTNVIVMNLIFLVFFTIFDFYALKKWLGLDYWFTNESTVFILCLASIVPLAFYIGQAVASISAQTSMGVGAVINAFFSTIVEIFLYCVALGKREGLLVEGSLIGSILGAVLLLPGLSMCGGAWNRKTQRYNPASAGVSSALLIFSMIVLFVPTMLYEIYGGYVVKCTEDDSATKGEMALSIKAVTMAVTSSQCYFARPPLKYDRLYTHILQPMSISCAVVLFLAYIIGLWFTLRTHAKMIWELPIADAPKENNEHVLLPNGVGSERNQNVEHEEVGGHEAPNWSRTKSTCILLFATLLYAIIAEILVACVDSVLENFPSLNPKFLGLTIFALVPNTTEFLNAISFAIHGNVALSMEIGTAYALQVCLLQIPALVLYSIIYTWNIPHKSINIREQMFTLIFPQWDLIASIASIFMFTYLFAEGKSNYFKGSVLILMYIILISGFYFQDIITSDLF